mgnify:CR=1 FL=1
MPESHAVAVGVLGEKFHQSVGHRGRRLDERRPAGDQVAEERGEIVDVDVDVALEGRGFEYLHLVGAVLPSSSSVTQASGSPPACVLANDPSGNGASAKRE